jgi:hypothetical protein
MPTRPINLEFPGAGLDRRLAYQRQKPFTTPFLVNVRSTDPLESRRRGGSRPDLAKRFAQELGTTAGTEAGTSSGTTFDATAGVFIPTMVGHVITMDTSANTYTIVTYTSATQVVVDSSFAGGDAGDTFVVSGFPVNMLEVVRTTNTSGATTLLDPLDTDDNWGAPSWATGKATFADGEASGTDDTDEYGAVLTSNIPSTNQTAERVIAANIVPTTAGQIYAVWANMDNSSPLDSDSVAVKMQIDKAATTFKPYHLILFVDDGGNARSRVYVWRSATPGYAFR